MAAQRAKAGNVSLHAQPVGNRLLAGQADGAFWRVNGRLRAILPLLEARPLVRTNFTIAFGFSLSAWHAPQAVESVLRKVPQALSYLVATYFPLPPKTAAIAERHNLTYKRRLRSTRGFFRDDTFAGLIRLLELKHNCARNDGADWLHLAAADLWPQPIQLHHNTAQPPALPTPPSKAPPTTAYTIGGT